MTPNYTATVVLSAKEIQNIIRKHLGLSERSGVAFSEKDGRIQAEVIMQVTSVETHNYQSYRGSQGLKF